MLHVTAVDQLVQDVRYAIRTFIRSRAFTAVAVLSLTLGIGANTAIFSLINAIVLRSLPVRHPEELFALSRPQRSVTISTFAYSFYREASQRKDLFSGVIFERTIAPSFSAGAGAELLSGEAVSANYFHVLGTIPYAGRLFGEGDETAPGADRVVVLSYGFWKAHFGTDHSIVGKTIYLNQMPMTIIGIAPPEYRGLRPGAVPDICVPVTMWPLMLGEPNLPQSRWFGFVLCRLRPGVPPGRAESALAALYRNRRESSENSSEPDRIALLPAATGLDSPLRRASKQLYVLMAVVCVVLLATCVNLSNLLLARTASRQHEIAVRLSLGATRFRILSQLLTESVLLAGTGGVFGLLFAHWGARLLSHFLLAGQFGALIDVTPDGLVLLFTLAVAVMSGLLFGVVPALRSRGCDVLRRKRERLAFWGTRIRVDTILIAGQLALSLLLLIAAGLFLQSLDNLHGARLGFDPRHVLEIETDPKLAGYGPERAREFYRETRDRVSRLPNVHAAAFSYLQPMRNLHLFERIQVKGRQPQQDDPGSELDRVGPGFFKTLGIPILRGREFRPADTDQAPHIAIVSETFARYYFGQKNPIGELIRYPAEGNAAANYEIVGVAGDVKFASLRQPAPRIWYVPYEQDSATEDNLTLYVRTGGAPADQIAAIRKAISSVDPNVPVFHAETLEQQIADSTSRDRMVAVCASFLGLLTALLAGVGLYGTVRYRVVARTHEIGIRIALGANARHVIGPVMIEVAWALALGALMGMGSAIALGRFVASMLFGLKPADPLTFGTASLFLAAVALIASYLPARRAARIEPLITLRYE